MACCGGQREVMRTHYSKLNRKPGTINGRVVVEYTGSASLVVKGAVTGRGYAFAGYGARAAVDARDAPALMRVPYLQRLLR